MLLQSQQHKILRRTLLASAGQMTYHIIGYMQLWGEKLEGWEDDPEQYISDEDLDSTDYSLRIVGCEVLQHMSSCLGSKTVLPLVLEAVQSRLGESRERLSPDVKTMTIRGFGMDFTAFFNQLISLLSETTSSSPSGSCPLVC